MSRLEERIENFNRAYELFQRMYNMHVNNPEDEAYRLALVQCFEIVFEISWKLMKDYLKIKGSDEPTTPNDTFKAMFASENLPNAQVWIDMTKDRNFSSHEYNMKKFDEIIEKIDTKYYNAINEFYLWVSKGVNKN